MEHRAVPQLCSVYTYASDRMSWVNDTPRRIYILSYQVTGHYDHTFSFGVLPVTAGSVFLINPNDTYRVRCVERGHAICVTFSLPDDLPTTRLDAATQPRYETLFRRLLRYTDFETSDSSRYAVMSLVYELLGMLTAEWQPSYVPTGTKKIYADVQRYLLENYTSPTIDLTERIRQSGVSDKYFRTKFRALYGTTPRQYLIDLRLNAAVRLLEAGNMSVTEVAQAVGFSDIYYFSRLFRHRFSCPPSRFTQQQER
ncbi:MAG: helix-turn-helix transcriptional regulator [Ruminococcaceae bacterium]|nr:helix-turn-helix transcriptional regulator [Oscillospiraceae bacterium]